MTVETALYPPSLNTAWPLSGDLITEGDNQIRLVKTVVKTTMPNVTGAITATHTQINHLVGVTAPVQTQIDTKAAKAGDTYTGAHDFTGAMPTFATASAGDSSTKPATTAYVQGEFSVKFTGLSGAVTATTAEMNYLVGVTSGIQTQINAKAAKAGDTYTGSHDMTGAALTVATATVGDSSAKAASTAFVTATSFVTVLPGQSGNAKKFVTTDGTNASWAFPELPIEFVSTSQTATIGAHSIITSGSVTLTIPALTLGQVVAFSNASGTTTAVVDFGSAKLQGLTPGAMRIDTTTFSKTIIGTSNATYGYTSL